MELVRISLMALDEARNLTNVLPPDKGQDRGRQQPAAC
jgi:hypothetical protein